MQLPSRRVSNTGLVRALLVVLGGVEARVEWHPVIRAGFFPSPEAFVEMHSKAELLLRFPILCRSLQKKQSLYTWGRPHSSCRSQTCLFCFLPTYKPTEATQSWNHRIMEYPKLSHWFEFLSLHSSWMELFSGTAKAKLKQKCEYRNAVLQISQNYSAISLPKLSLSTILFVSHRKRVR